jgi:hypothetical protein
MAGASLSYRIRLALAREAKSVEVLAAELEVRPGSIRTTLNRHRREHGRGLFVQIADSKPQLWALAVTVPR